MNFSNPPATASARVRSLWKSFEQSQVKDRSQLDTTVLGALQKAEAEWNKTPHTIRMSRTEHNATKEKLAKAIKSSYFEKARAKWQEKLECVGLKAEFWTDPTEDEMRRITRTLGADDENDEELMLVPDPPPPPPAPATTTSTTQPPPPPHFFQPMAPSFSTSSRATNLSSSSYAFVNPSEFNSEEEDFEFEIPLSNPVATSVDLTSEEDDDAIFSVPVYPANRPAHIGSGFSRASSIHNQQPLASDFLYNTAPNRTSQNKRPPPQVEPKPSSTSTKPRIPRQPYVGPSLDATPDEPSDEELEFEKFKMRTRMQKIVEFHEAAALAEISLSIEIYKARKQLNNSKEEDAPRVLEHQKRMVQLQKEKEEERKAIVKSERARRQSDLGRRMNGKTPNSSSAAFKTWGLSSFQEEMPIDLPSRFNLDTLLSEDPAKQHVNVETLLNEMFADDSQPEAPPAGLFNDYYQEGFRTQEQRHSSMSWTTKPQSDISPKPVRKTHLSPFGESSDEEDDHKFATATAAAASNENDKVGWTIDEVAKPMWNRKPPAAASAWSSKDVRATPVSSAWSSKKTGGAAVVSQLRQASSPLIADEVEPELNTTPTTTTTTNSKTVKGKKPWASAPDKSSVSPPVVETTAAAAASAKAPVVEAPTVPPKVDKPIPTPAPAVPAPAGKKGNKKQKAANNKKGGAAAAAPAAIPEPAVPEQEPEVEPIPAPTQQESPTVETAPPAPEPMFPGSEHVAASWLPKMVPGMARARLDSGPPPPPMTNPSFWDEVASTPRPAPKIPAHLQESLALKSEGTIRLKKNMMMAEVFNATSSRTTLEQMPPPLPPVGNAKGVWAPTPGAAPGPSLWGKTKADFEAANAKVVPPPPPPQPAAAGGGGGGGDFWVPGGFDSVGNYDEGDGGGGGGDEDVGGLWESMAAHSKQIGKSTSIPAKQPVTTAQRLAQRLRRVSEAASSSAPRTLVVGGTKDNKDTASDLAPTQPTNSNSTPKKARGKKNAKGKQPQRVTVEDVSDEEKDNDNIDILPINSNHIMESKTIVEPKPSVPSAVYNSIIDFTDSDEMLGNGNGYGNGYGYGSSGLFRPSTASSSSASASADDVFGFPGGFKTQGGNNNNNNNSVGVDWGAMMGGGKHARWTPAVNSDREASGSPPPPPSFFGSRVQQAKPNTAQQQQQQQQTPIWGQPTKAGSKDKGKGKI